MPSSHLPEDEANKSNPFLERVARKVAKDKKFQERTAENRQSPATHRSITLDQTTAPGSCAPIPG